MKGDKKTIDVNGDKWENTNLINFPDLPSFVWIDGREPVLPLSNPSKQLEMPLKVLTSDFGTLRY